MKKKISMLLFITLAVVAVTSCNKYGDKESEMAVNMLLEEFPSAEITCVEKDSIYFRYSSIMPGLAACVFDNKKLLDERDPEGGKVRKEFIAKCDSVCKIHSNNFLDLALEYDLQYFRDEKPVSEHTERIKITFAHQGISKTKIFYKYIDDDVIVTHESVTANLMEYKKAVESFVSFVGSLYRY
ncbi:MAG: hypothetical protein II296_08715 [Bacteroidaceae bacterium]|nr:hypothetical protein [Bacteroidaceae bacterium]